MIEYKRALSKKEKRIINLIPPGKYVTTKDIVARAYPAAKETDYTRLFRLIWAQIYAINKKLDENKEKYRIGKTHRTGNKHLFLYRTGTCKE